MPTKKTTMGSIRKIIRILFTLFIIYFGVALLFENVPFLNRYQHYIIVTGSMDPIIKIGDVVIIDQNLDYNDLEVGDIVMFDTTINNQEVVVVHYVHSINEEEGTFLTRPENSLNPDNWVLNESDLIGSYLFRIPQIGRFLVFAQSTVGRIVIILDVLLIYVLYRMFIKKK